MTISSWIFLAFVALAVGFFPLLALITLVGSRFEKMRLSYSWRDLPESAMPARPKELLQAIDAGMQVLRTGQEQSSSVISVFCWLTLSEDGLIAGCFGKGRLGSSWMVLSRLSDGTFLVTKAGIGTPLVPPRRVELDEMQTEQFSDMLLVHRSRLDRNVLPSEQLTADRLPQLFTDAQRGQYEDLIDAGYAVWLDPRQTVAKLTSAASLKVAGRILTIPFRISQFKRRAEELKPAATGFPVVGVNLQSDHVVITRAQDGGIDYVYHDDGSGRALALFTSAARAREYHRQHPGTPGEHRALQTVDDPWLQQCREMGHRLWVDPGVPDSATTGRNEVAVAGVPAPADMCVAAQLAGLFAAHAVWCVSGDATLIPLLGLEAADGTRKMVRLAAERLEDGVAQGKERLESNPDGAARAVLVYDGLITTEVGRSDALIITARDYTQAQAELNLAIPYRPASDPAGFAVHRPKFLACTGAEPNWQAIGEALWSGIALHGKGAEVWDKHLDESR